ncbi:hypothetical protein GGI35DRAFT_202727 [Trichoderma velutinum]
MAQPSLIIEEGEPSTPAENSHYQRRIVPDTSRRSIGQATKTGRKKPAIQSKNAAVKRTCHQCLRKFARPEHLKHIFGHSGRRPHKCPCGRSFARIDAHKAHVKKCPKAGGNTGQRDMAGPVRGSAERCVSGPSSSVTTCDEEILGYRMLPGHNSIMRHWNGDGGSLHVQCCNSVSYTCKHDPSMGLCPFCMVTIAAEFIDSGNSGYV